MTDMSGHGVLENLNTHFTHVGADGRGSHTTPLFFFFFKPLVELIQMCVFCSQFGCFSPWVSCESLIPNQIRPQNRPSAMLPPPPYLTGRASGVG